MTVTVAPDPALSAPPSRWRGTLGRHWVMPVVLASVLLGTYLWVGSLDLDAIEELERALGGYDGTLMVVSHDRRLLANLRLDRRLEVVAGRVAEAPLPVAAPG